MKRFCTIALASLAAGALACAAGAPADLTEAEQAEITAAVEASMDGYREAALSRNLDGLLALWANVDGFVLAADGEIADYTGLEEGLRAEMATIQSVPYFELSDRHTYVLARDAASHTTRYRWSAILTTGDTLRVRGSWVYVLKNFDGAWRVVHSGGAHVPE